MSPNSCCCLSTLFCISFNKDAGSIFNFSLDFFFKVSTYLNAATRTLKNSSRFDEKMAINFIFSCKGTDLSFASWRTLLLKDSQLKSRLKKLILSMLPFIYQIYRFLGYLKKFITPQFSDISCQDEISKSVQKIPHVGILSIRVLASVLAK